MKINWEKFFQSLGSLGKIIMGTIIGALVIYLLVIIFTGDPDYLRHDKKTVKNIEKKIDTLQANDKFLTERIYEIESRQIQFYDAINENNKAIHQNNEELSRLKKLYNAKINNVDHYSINDLDSFFRTRYSRYYNQTP
jgi:hypothetical protein